MTTKTKRLFVGAPRRVLIANLKFRGKVIAALRERLRRADRKTHTERMSFRPEQQHFISDNLSPRP